MKRNIGSIDKAIRVSLAALIIMYSYVGLLDGLLEVVLLVLATAFILTSAVGVCPFYSILGINTAPISEEEPSE